jgi:hypothetical protein
MSLYMTGKSARRMAHDQGLHLRLQSCRGQNSRRDSRTGRHTEPPGRFDRRFHVGAASTTRRPATHDRAECSWGMAFSQPGPRSLASRVQRSMQGEDDTTLAGRRPVVAQAHQTQRGFIGVWGVGCGVWNRLLHRAGAGQRDPNTLHATPHTPGLVAASVHLLEAESAIDAFDNEPGWRGRHVRQGRWILHPPSRHNRTPPSPGL